MNGTSTMLRRIVFPLESSAHSESALRYAMELASAAKARLEDAAAVAGTEPPLGLIVMATHGRTGLSQAVLGSTAHDVLRASDKPLVVVHPRSVPADSLSAESAVMGSEKT
jgi:nucleotide-binding universal stress UspA family protein